MTGTIRLAELTGAIALAADAGTGFPPETSLRLCLVATALSRALGESEQETRDVYHAALLRHAGCTASAHEETRLAGDEIELRSTIALGDAGRPQDLLPRLVKGVAREQRLDKRVRSLGRLLAQAPAVLPVALRGRCEVAIRFAVRLGLGARVARALDEGFERWDGRGMPNARKGAQIGRPARIVALAELAAAYAAVGGIDAARRVVAERSGGQVDPELAACFAARAPELMADALAPALWERVLEVEPRPYASVGALQQRVAAELLADFADLKSTWTLGHSRGVAQRALQAAVALGATPEEQRRVELAALVHDLGRVAVSNALWDKPGPYTRGERELARTHAYHTDRILGLIGGELGDVAGLASLAHERLDASGYHRGLSAVSLSKWARLLAAADVAQALSEARPHRAAFAADAAAKALHALCAQGMLCSRATEALLDAAGSGGGAPRRASYPAGLSEREVQVLRLVARGLTDKEVASQLGISHRTVHHHNKHAYDKIGVSTRAAAALFLVENALLER